MCWHCEQIDKEITHYRGLLRRVTEQQSVKSVDILIATLEAEKRALHALEFWHFAKTAPPS